MTGLAALWNNKGVVSDAEVGYSHRLHPCSRVACETEISSLASKKQGQVKLWCQESRSGPLPGAALLGVLNRGQPLIAVWDLESKRRSASVFSIRFLFSFWLRKQQSGTVAVTDKYDEELTAEVHILELLLFFITIALQQRTRFTIFCCHGKWCWDSHLWWIIYAIMYSTTFIHILLFVYVTVIVLTERQFEDCLSCAVICSLKRNTKEVF